MEKSLEEAALLVAQNGPLAGQRWPLGASIIIGRDSTCDIVIPDRQVSRQHACVSITDEGVIIEDLRSKNGTNHNGLRIDGPLLLEDGDEIQIAVAQKFIYLSSDATLPLDKRDEYKLSLEIGENIEDHVIPISRLRLDKRSHRVWIAQKGEDDSIEEIEILPPLSVSQFRLLEKLYENQGLVVPRPELVATVWGENQAFEVSEQALDALIRRLRDRIASTDPDHAYIVTVRGHGLRLDNPTH
jgi:pSer/pThr/pTyr-binding forkhead associated (FHA) protein